MLIYYLYIKTELILPYSALIMSCIEYKKIKNK